MEFDDFVLSQLARPPSRVLDVGCGEGQLALTLARAGHDVTAIDPVAPDGPIFERVTLEEFAASHSFDAVVASRSLHHVPSLDRALDKIGQLAPLVIIDEFVWDRLDERTGAWYLEHVHGPPKSIRDCMREWDEEHRGLHGYEALRAGLDRHFHQRFFAWRPYLYRYPEVDSGQQSEQALIDAGSINALGFRYIGATRRGNGSRL